MGNGYGLFKIWVCLPFEVLVWKVGLPFRVLAMVFEVSV